MRPDRFYPYRTGGACIQLAVSRAGADIGASPVSPLEVYRDQADPIQLNVSATLPDDVLPDVLARTEISRPPVAVRLLCKSVESRQRTSLLLGGESVHKATLELRRSDWVGAVELRAVLVRTSANADLPAGFATDQGSVLAWSDPFHVLLEPPRLAEHRQIEIKWENFETSVDPWRKAHSKNLFALDVSGGVPVIYLNERIPRARLVLGRTGTTGRAARVRDATFYLIVHQVWSSLVAITLAELAELSPGEPVGEVDPEARLSELRDWQREVIRFWSQYLYPDEDPETARERVIRVAGDPSGTIAVLQRLPNAIQERFGTVRGFEGLAGELDHL